MFKFSEKRITLSVYLVFSLLAFFSPIQAKEPLSVYLTWQKNPESTMTIQWITPLDETLDRVQYKIKGDSKWQTADGHHIPMPDKVPYWIHSIELTALQPDSYYSFTIGSQKTEYKFHTMSIDPSKPIRFIDGGDVYHDGLDILEKMNRQAAKLNPMFAIVGGDIAYNDDKHGAHPNEMPRWMDFLIAWKNQMVTPDGCLIPMIPAIGNHDVKRKAKNASKPFNQAPFFYALFAFPGNQGYNVLDFGNVMSLIILDTAHTHPIEGQQAYWLCQTLEKRQKVPHKFVSYHVGAYPSYRSFDGDTATKIRKYWVPLFEKFGVAAVFEHHDHTYKRTWPLRNNKVDFDNGVLYLGDGAWGVDPPRTPKPAESIWYLAQSKASRHVIFTTIHGKERHFMAIDDHGKIIDEVMSLQKN